MESHPFGSQFVAHFQRTQTAYAERRSLDYLAGFAEHYYSVQLHSQWGEDKVQLAAKIASDIERFELLSMDLRVLRVWFSGEVGYGHLRYITRLRHRNSGRVLIDKRENILVGEHSGEGKWLIVCKIVVRARNYYEQPDI